ncbi:type II secretion system F family protein [Herbaspirillum sp. alder98]|uniref:type II secretion system F family protein n=1 Tax=Herbaspirillum sp. alder98 TaxID=2913096 RepID=UPI001CD83F88|nr:type II secretion system F family protein [Herbaspirillum sp. alder98]MCA1324461.1 type II secretion system F family protein [Herbaspirillum sp. alder98]
MADPDRDGPLARVGAPLAGVAGGCGTSPGRGQLAGATARRARRLAARQAAIARWSRTFGTLFGAGVVVLEALESAAGSAGNIVYAEASLAMREAIGHGTNLHTAMRNTGVFPEMAIQMVAVGEESGALDAMLSRVAELCEREVDDAVNALTSLMEPIIMAVLGILIGGLVVAMYLPIFNMGSVL